MSAASATVAPAPELAGSKPPDKPDARWDAVMPLPCHLSVDISLPSFKVSDFIRMRPGSVITTSWSIAHDVPLRVNGVLIAWGELEGAGNRLAVRVTELA